jgi:hypothetical protein
MRSVLQSVVIELKILNNKQKQTNKMKGYLYFVTFVAALGSLLLVLKQG